MPREIDDAWIEEAITSYRRIEQRRAAYAEAMASVEVSVRSSDELVEVIVGAAGEIRRVALIGPISGRSAAELNRSIQQALASAQDAAGWARRKVHEENFSDYAPVGRS